MAHHTFNPTHYHTAIGTYKPVLHIADGDTVSTTTVDAGGKDKTGAQATEGGNPQTGPFYIEGAQPGDTLAITFDHLMPNRPWGYTSARVAPNVLDPGYVPKFDDDSAASSGKSTLPAKPRARSKSAPDAIRPRAATANPSPVP